MSLTVEQFVTTGFSRSIPAPNSQKNYRNHIGQFEAFLKQRGKTASDGTVADQDILEYIEYLKSKYHPNTVATKVASIKSYFKWLQKEGVLTHIPHIQSQPHIKTTHKELEAFDLNNMIHKMTGDDIGKQRDRAMFALIVYCGFKTEEVVAMNSENINFETFEVTIVKDRKYGIPLKEKRSFRGASSEMLAYAKAKVQNGFYWGKRTIKANGLTWEPVDTKDKKEPFFLNKHHLRISGRSLRRRILAYLGHSNAYQMRDLRHTYLKNLDRVIQAKRAAQV